MAESPSYYAILTADVRYDKNLSANEKLLFAEITTLTYATGWCWASNNYFANLFDVTPQAISKWVNKLKKLGYIEVEIQYDKDNPKVISGRYIKPIGNSTRGVSTEDLGVSTTVEGGINTRLGGYQQRIKDNNTSDNNTSDNNISIIKSEPKKKPFQKPTIQQINAYIIQNNLNVDAERFYYYYESNGWVVGKTKMVNWKACVHTWNRKASKPKRDPVDEYMDAVIRGEVI